MENTVNTQAIELERVKMFSEKVNKIKEELKKDVVGQKEIIDNVIIAIVAGGNVLLEGVPGVGKTRLVRSLGRVLSLPFSRIQFTPDLMPSDVTGAFLFRFLGYGFQDQAFATKRHTAPHTRGDGQGRRDFTSRGAA